MDQNTEEVRRKPRPERDLDAMDRKLLGALVEDATMSYAELGDRVGLSPPAAHERVKRLRRSGAIRRVAALIDPEAVGKTLLAFVHVDTTGWGKTPALLAIEEHPEVEEVHSVAGDTCMLLKVRTESTHALEGLLARLYDTPGVKATRSYVVLSTYLERPVQPGVTSEWPALAKNVEFGTAAFNDHRGRGR
ncbi:AsnC family transcriptional regulator [Ensifer sp. T173]|uniref:AsnC family transcriptional regulator n=1 Tax=Ensifer canadensis TaxID=555315 RepID=A0AAW4FVB8_9HYPH|nr:Lrp/AsnC family transcriptional regulator [Ensifer canadensis]AHK45744.1 transcriptional regulator, AsnC family related [Ensifer adhaerens OV14]MBM3095376.1 AsnC family transcriptional regulator [Ensifer canadensis]UBI77785.1 Lrp/AsnC family transcriptional regulator [Ensifer canadensis]